MSSPNTIGMQLSLPPPPLSLSLLSSCVTSRFETLINMCVEVLHDVMDLTEDDIIFE